MSTFLDTFSRLSAAEEIFDFLGVPYDAHVVRVNRLHILKRMHDYLRRESSEGLGDAALRDVYRAALTRAHADFSTSNAVTEKVFKVFRDQAGQGFVGLDDIEVLPARG